MASCPPRPAPVSPSWDGPAPFLYGGTDVSPVLRPSAVPTPTTRQECDARTALTRGLARYLAGLEVQGNAGRVLAFGGRVYESWADPEVQATFPSAVVLGSGPARYDASRLVPSTVGRIALPDGRAVIAASEMELTLSVDVWATDSRARAALVGGLESALCPNEWRYGLLLDLPFYFGARAAYELTAVEYQDSEEGATRRYRRALISLVGTVPVYRLTMLPEARPRQSLTVEE